MRRGQCPRPQVRAAQLQLTPEGAGVRNTSLICFATAIALLCIPLGASAQDEMPKDSSASPVKKAPVAPPLPVPPAAADNSSELPPPGTMTDEPAAVLQALDKVTARVRRIAVKVGQAANFGTLSVKLDACRKAPPEDAPESAAFLEITDRGSSGPPRTVFSGWMFASSPALSAMDHPVYDISVVDCASEAAALTAASASSTPSAATPR
jgi:hypothetical protein